MCAAVAIACLLALTGCLAASSTDTPAADVPGTDVPVTGVSLSASASMGIGESQTLTATVLPFTATIKTLAWDSSVPGVATVDSSGLVTGAAVGTAIITATSVSDNTKKSSCNVTIVTSVPVLDISIQANASLNIGSSRYLAVLVTPGDASNKAVSWISDAPSVASVNGTTGLITGVAAGTAHITATSLSKAAETSTCTVTVSAPVPLPSVTWSSETPATATVDSVTGEITAVAAGTTVITATAPGGLTDTCALTVAPAPPNPAWLYKTAAGAVDIATVAANWSTGTVRDTAYALDATYNPCMKLTQTAGSWGNVIAFTGITAGKVAEYTNIEFKVKTSSYTDIKVKVPEVEKTYALTGGTALADGWIQMSVPMSDFLSAPNAAVEFAIFGSGNGTLYLTDICLSGLSSGSAAATLDNPSSPAVSPSPSVMSGAVVLFSDEKTSDANVTTFIAPWSSNIDFAQIEINAGEAITGLVLPSSASMNAGTKKTLSVSFAPGNKVLRYSSNTTGSGASGSGTAGIEMAPLNVSAKTSLHMDLYAIGDIDLLKMKFVSAGSGAGYAAMLDNYSVTVKENWFSIDIPLSSIPKAPGAAGTVAWSALGQIVFIIYGPASTITVPTRFYVDNLYFY